jgi:epoxyqueuosine reductase
LPYAPGSRPPRDRIPEGHGRIAAYAAGRDYHRVFEKRLRRAARRLREEHGANVRATVDYGPLLERPLARLAGVGWEGKSTMLLAPGYGPWLLLGAVATDLCLEPDGPLRKSCGSCRRCITACPTGALAGDGGTLDARRCISYHTIENRGSIPRDLRASFGAWIFGCDLCLEACPPGWRSFASTSELEPAANATAPALAPLLDLTDEQFAERYRGRPILRAKRDGFLRNVCIALGNVGTRADLPVLLAAFDDPAPLVRGHAAWAAARLALRLGVESASSATHQALTPLLQDTSPEVREEARLALADLGSAIRPHELPPSG